MLDHEVESKVNKVLKAEIISVGDEIISGQRLDTNTQWLAGALGELGIPVHFHSSVGDDVDDHVAVLNVAIARADIVVMTGGLGPTADDLTRLAIAGAAGVELEFSELELQKIEAIFRRYGRPMPANNRTQAWFPVGSTIIPNPEGTAPGIDFMITRNQRSGCRIFALPGVPAEMKQMWSGTVEPELKKQFNTSSTFYHHSLHCFGAGESQIESMLPDLVQRGRDPKVGITASAATITLRVSTRAANKSACLAKMRATIDTIRECLGPLIFGENDQTLDEVVRSQLLSKNLTVAIADGGLGGEVIQAIGSQPGMVVASQVLDETSASGLNDLSQFAKKIQQDFGASMGLAIGPLDFDETKIALGRSEFSVAIVGPAGTDEVTYRFGGHSDWRMQRAVKQVLNQLRLYLLR